MVSKYYKPLKWVTNCNNTLYRHSSAILYVHTKKIKNQFWPKFTKTELSEGFPETLEIREKATEKLWKKEMPATRGSLRLLSHLSWQNEIDWRKVRVIQIILKCTVCGNPVQGAHQCLKMS